PRHPTYRRYLGFQLAQLGSVLRRLQQFPEAEAAYRETVAIQQKLQDDFPNTPAYRRDLASTCNALAGLLGGGGRRGEAEAVYRQSLALRETLVSEFPTAPGHYRDLAWFLVVCPDPQFRNAERAVRLATRAVEQAPRGWDCWRTLGVAQYRA